MKLIYIAHPFGGEQAERIVEKERFGFELDAHYCDIANERIQKALAEKGLRR